MQVNALAKGVKMSPRKAAIVADLVRGHSVADAITILAHTPRRSVTPVRKAIESAKANAERNHNLRPDSLVILSIEVTAGPRLKRYNPAARGQALPYQKKSSHIKVVVEGEKRVPKKAQGETKKETK